MNLKLWCCVGSGILVATSACGEVLEENLFSPPPPGYGQDGGGAGSGAGSGSGSGAASGGGDIPCDVATVLATHCDSCHGAAIPPALTSRADFLASAPSDSSKSLGEVSLERMQDTAMPMPPAGVPPTEDVQIFADWVAAGMPAGDCGGGTGGSGGNPYDVPEMCSSGSTWSDGTDGTVLMYPGRACNDCHATEKPDEIAAFAGTVYPTAHEPDDCLGVGAAEATIEITDANDMTHTTTTNASGNFWLQGSYAFPVTVRVLANGDSLAMVTELQPEDGDCNVCHTQDGADGAPGRIILPF